MRRRKKIIKKILIIAIAVGIILLLYFFFFKRIKKIDSGKTSNNKGEAIELQIASEPKVEIILPETIIDKTTNETSEKTYEPITSNEDIEKQKKYLETITNEFEITIMLGDDAQELLPPNSPIIIGQSYSVEGIEEPMKTTYSFTVEGYKYPIILAQTQSGHLEFIDSEEAFRTGTFRIVGRLADIENVDRVYETIAEENGKNYNTAVISTADGEGYEFNLKMINK